MLFINLIPLSSYFFHKSLHTPIVLHTQMQGNQSQEALQRALEHIHSHCLGCQICYFWNNLRKHNSYGVLNLPYEIDKW